MTETWSYIARTTQPTKYWPMVGTAIAAAVDCPEMDKHNSESLAEWLRDGLTIERVPCDWVRKHLFTTEPYRSER
jgi:hypothetical protein